MYSVDDIAGVFLIIIADAVYITIGFAAALLACKLCITNSGGNPSKAIQHSGILCIETVTQTIVNAIQLASDLLRIESLLHFSAGQRAIVAIAPAVITPAAYAKQEQEEDDYPILLS